MKISLPPFLKTPVVERIFQAFPDANTHLRFVGGCVRDAILGKTTSDIDLATPLIPADVINILDQAAIKHAPTGISHGTITAIIDKQPFEITTLRRDLETDGRHAVVAYTDQWEEDAARRDFTINSLYMDHEGQVYDYFGGLKDLESGTLKFIGDPRARIQEDYLRILRFFRFYGRFAKTGPEKLTREALRDLGPGLQKISKERITKEILLTLSQTSPQESFQLMHSLDLAPFACGGAISPDALNSYIQLESFLMIKQTTLGRLLALSRTPLVDLINFFSFSNSEDKWLKNISAQRLQPKSYAHFFYEAGIEDLKISLALQILNQRIQMHEAKEVIQEANTWPALSFPLKGEDFHSCGLNGRAIGVARAKVLDWWIDGYFKASHQECLTFLRDQLKSWNLLP